MAYTVPINYQSLTAKTIIAYLAQKPDVLAVLGDMPENWQAQEVGDGNLNLVFIIRSKHRSVVAKQALPYVRLVGESWPLPLSRIYFEHEALLRHADVARDHVPAIVLYDHDMALIVMEHLTPHIILRKGLIRGENYPHFAKHAGTFLAATLFDYSDFKLNGEKKKKNLALFCDNHVMCGLSEQVIFDDPYFEAELNHHTTPQLDGIASEIRQDARIKRAAQELKSLFMSKTQTLVHGDLHSGSIMVTYDEMRVIDPEFAFYGPMGFDIGALTGNLLLAYFSQPGHEKQAGERARYAEWILQTLTQTVQHFEQNFAEKWHQERGQSLYGATLFDRSDRVLNTQLLSQVMRDVMIDAIGFAGAKMIRRILGVAHVEDFEQIEDPDLRADCERKALRLGCIMITDRTQLADFSKVAQLARVINLA